MTPRRILLVSTIRPQSDRSGTELRARTVLRMLAARAEVTLVLGFFDSDGEPPLPDRLQREHGGPWGLRVIVVPMGGGLQQAHARLGEALGESRFDAVFVFRPESIVLARALLDRAPVAVLDMDELGSRRETALAKAFARDGLHDDAAVAMRRARYCELLERDAFRQFDAVLVSSEAERRGLPAWAPPERVFVLPNVYPDLDPLPPDADEAGRRLLFIGKYDYYANEDGMRWFATEVWPRIRAEIPEAEFLVGGSGRLRRPREIEHIEGLRLLGHVADLAAAYRDAHVVVIPLRLGCGTRLKLLEAMRFGRCVVSTSTGAEGVNVVPEVHVAIADDPASMARACVDLLRDGNRRRALALAARPVAIATYDEAALQRIWAGVESALFPHSTALPAGAEACP